MHHFNENSRVKIPALIHLSRLGYSYLSLRDSQWDTAHNIFTPIFRESILRINSDASDEDITRVLQEISLLLDNEDVGRAFYDRLTRTSGLRLIDFDDFDNNSFHVVTELPYKNGEEEFRPDITLLINGMPLSFVEVKKPNNRDGMLDERARLNRRFKNPQFRRFANLTQFMVFSNNMEYDPEAIDPLAGAFYAASSYDSPHFNYFREEEEEIFSRIAAIDPATEKSILSDNNLVAIQHCSEYHTNLASDTPTHRLLTSLFHRERLAFILRFAFAYVRSEVSLEKHIMRYPQMFATRAIARKLLEGIRKGIIWHTQGSGKTALAFYNVHFLMAWFQQQGIVPKFYFIVDRIDLLQQAASEFRSRGLHVHTIDSREDFTRDIKSTKSIHNDSGTPEITVVNIQKFRDDPDVVRSSDYALNLQRVYFLDEVHRSYNPHGSFLANLNESDSQAIKIGLTGTPLLGDHSSKALFGDYIHKYYYNNSVRDGYTLRLIREEIETQYRLQLAEVLDQIQVQQGIKERKFVYAHESFVGPMLEYIVTDFERSRIALGDSGIGAMVICDSADQARTMARLFQEKYAYQKPTFVPETEAKLAAHDFTPYLNETAELKPCLRHALILHDEGTKQERKDWVEQFKDGHIDILFVYNMLLTGFDAKRLKKLYLGRMVKAHNLLQALTRVNRPYKSFRYGYVVDFADITKEFDKTNKAYFDELQTELGNETEHYSALFKSEEEMTAEIEQIKDALVRYDVTNAEHFSQQLSQIQDPAALREIIKALEQAKSLYNLIRLSGRYEMLDELDFRKLRTLGQVAHDRLALVHQRDALERDESTRNLLHIALEDVLFTFRKIGEGELRIADELKDFLRRTREGLLRNFDPRDPAFVSLREELERLFKKKNLSEITQEDMQANITALKDIHARAHELERINQLLRAKYAHDAKYARIHKRLLEKGEPTTNERKLIEALQDLKQELDAKISENAMILTNQAFAEKMITRLVLDQLMTRHQLPLTAESCRFIQNLILREYLDESDNQLA